MFEHLLTLDICFVLNSGPHGEGTVQLQDDAISEFDLGTRLLKHLTLQFESFVMLCDLKSSSRGVSVLAAAISFLWKMLVTYSSSLVMQWGVYIVCLLVFL